MAGLEIVSGHVPGALGGVVALHGTYYHEHWGFGPFFEAKVATELARFLTTFEVQRDGFWTVSMDGRVQASIAIDGTRAGIEGAHLRWFIVSDSVRGEGVGRELLDTAMAFCRARDYPRVYLWTFAGLDAARHLYDRAGFRLVEEQRGYRWGTEVLEQRLECELAAPT